MIASLNTCVTYFTGFPSHIAFTSVSPLWFGDVFRGKPLRTFKSSAALFLPRMVAGPFDLLPTETYWSLLLVYCHDALLRCSGAHSQLSVRSHGMGFLRRYVASNELSPLLSLS